MLVISDIHDAADALARVVRSEPAILILGDLVNLTDYRTGEGAVAEVLGLDFARSTAVARGRNDYQGMRQMWSGQMGERRQALVGEIGERLSAQYERVRLALQEGSGYVIHGNVDRPSMLQEILPPRFEYVHGRAVTIEGVRFGFIGGGMQTPLNAVGEISETHIMELIDQLGAVDVLCSHVPPDIEPLRRDVITGRLERASGALRDYIVEYRPMFHLFGDVHQPQASIWRVGRTRCVNVGYFRATGRGFRLDLKSIRRQIATLT